MSFQLNLLKQMLGCYKKVLLKIHILQSMSKLTHSSTKLCLYILYVKQLRIISCVTD